MFAKPAKIFLNVLIVTTKPIEFQNNMLLFEDLYSQLQSYANEISIP